MKCDLKDCTFLITIRLDSVARIENLIMSTEWLLKYFDTNIFVLHSSLYENRILTKLLNKKIKYVFIEDRDDVFYRTHYHNIMTHMTHTPLICIWDADIIINVNQIIDCVEKMRSGVKVAYPYGGKCFNTSDIMRELFFKRRNIKILESNINKMDMFHNVNLKGGAMFVEKETYIEIGMENENFYGWGDEDYERFQRWKSYGYTPYIAQGFIFHLAHPRGLNSNFQSDSQHSISKRELFLSRISTKEELKQNL